MKPSLDAENSKNVEDAENHITMGALYSRLTRNETQGGDDDDDDDMNNSKDGNNNKKRKIHNEEDDYKSRSPTPVKNRNEGYKRKLRKKLSETKIRRSERLKEKNDRKNNNNMATKTRRTRQKQNKTELGKDDVLKIVEVVVSNTLNRNKFTLKKYYKNHRDNNNKRIPFQYKSRRKKPSDSFTCACTATMKSGNSSSPKSIFTCNCPSTLPSIQTAVKPTIGYKQNSPNRRRPNNTSSYSELTPRNSTTTSKVIKWCKCKDYYQEILHKNVPNLTDSKQKRKPQQNKARQKRLNERRSSLDDDHDDDDDDDYCVCYDVADAVTENNNLESNNEYYSNLSEDILDNSRNATKNQPKFRATKQSEVSKDKKEEE
ncbi:uncharacterized protein [Rhodnius prolixus]|uniref:Uncharacterized protein n=1 Tax=Rhodnius prolixus TaxID=13249 RepID=T1HRW4_RHOPR